MKQLRQALATSCVFVKKMRRQEVTIEQEKQDSQQRMADLEQEIQNL